MLFNSFQFLVFFPIVTAVFFFIPKKMRVVWLLIASYYFYMQWNVKYTFLLLLSTLLTYFGAIGIEKTEKNQSRKLILWTVLLANLGILAYFKYANFLLTNVNKMLKVVLPGSELTLLDIALPVGISFYIFQAIGYLLDVYRGTIKAEKNVIFYALFVSFFPQLVAGPIERSCNLLPQIRGLEKAELWDYRRVQSGCLTVLYGYFIKLVIADRAALLVNRVFWNYEVFPPSAYLLAIILFAIQIYCDFAGYSSIAVGCARILGVRLMDNFTAPYLARGIKDFWRRWHISLSTWFMDYLYIPLGGNRKGRLRKQLNLLIVFLISGLWHGASWHFVFWGMIHGVLRIIEELVLPLFKRKNRPSAKGFWTQFGKDGSIVLTFLLVAFALTFFRAESVHQAMDMIAAIFSKNWQVQSLLDNGSLWQGISKMKCAALIFPILILFVGDVLRDRSICFTEWFEKRGLLFRSFFFLIAILGILMFGTYGPGYDASAFIYFQF